MTLRRVVITGLGTVNPLGVGIEHSWKKLVQGGSGLVSLDEAQYEGIPCKIGARVPEGTDPGHWNATDWVKPSDIKRIALFAQYAFASAKQALSDARLVIDDTNRTRVGVAVGSSIGGIQSFAENAKHFLEKGYSGVSPLFIPNLLSNMAAGHISIQLGIQGVNHCVSTACTTGAHSIGDAANMIRFGMADAMIAGSSEAVLHPLAVAGFCRIRSLATRFNDRPHEASRPFDRNRAGFVMGEGAGIMVLESLEHAQAREADIYAEIVGYGMSGDANHITAPSDNGDGAYRSMKMALKTAEIEPEKVDYINAHATSTLLGDKAENTALTRLFKQPRELIGKKVNVSSSKGAIGHLLGGAGSVEAVFTILSLSRGILPPTINLHEIDEGFDLNYIPNKSQDAPEDYEYALTNSFGFGGTNASLLFKKWTGK